MDGNKDKVSLQRTKQGQGKKTQKRDISDEHVKYMKE